MSDKFYKNLRIIFLILAILCMGLSLLRKAKAEDYTVNDLKSFYINNLREYGDSIDPNFNYDAAFLPFDNGTLSYSFMLKDNTGSVAVVLCKYDDPVLKVGSSSFVQGSWGYKLSTKGGSNSYPYDFCGYKSNHNISWSTVIFRVINVTTLDINNHIYVTDFKCDWNEAKSFYYATHTYLNSVDGFSYSINSNISLASSSSPGILYIPEDSIYYGVDSASSNAFGNYEPYLIDSSWNNTNSISVISTNTEGFRVYKYGNDDNARLVCDFSDCISISPAISNSSSISLTINIDGVDTNFTFNSSDSYYSYSVSSGTARYSFPLSSFGLDNNTINAVLNNIAIENITSSPGGSFTSYINWVTPITLVGSDYSDASASNIPRDNLPDYDHIDDPSVQGQYKEITNRWLTTYYNSFPLSLFQRWNFEPKYIIQGVLPYNSSQAVKDALESALRNLGNLDFGNAVADALTIGQGLTLQEQITIYLQDNFYLTDLYDIICFAYQVDENTTHYYIYTTDSYNNHLSNSLTYDLLQAIYDDGKALDSIYNYLYDRLDDFEDKSLDKLNELVGLNEINNDLLSGFINSLNDKLNDILNAILNLDLEVPDADYSSITSRLDTIINHESEGFNSYQDWVKQLQDNASGNGIYKWVNGTIDSMKSAFSFFNLQDLDNNIAGDQTYIYYTNRYFEYLTQDTFFNRLYSGSLNIYDFNGGY